MKRATIVSICIWAFNIALWTHTAYVWNYPKPNPVVQDNCTKDHLEMPVELSPYFDEFIEDCKAHGIKYDHAYCLKYVGYMSTVTGDNGYTDYTDRVIRINTRLLEDTVGLKFVLYHEFGHWLGLRHSKGIMQTSYGSSDSLEVANNWDDLREEYFNSLKE